VNTIKTCGMQTHYIKDDVTLFSCNILNSKVQYNV